MKLYLSHSSEFDYISELYEPLKDSLAKNHDIVLPHDTNEEGVNSKDVIPVCDLMLAEVSHPSTGQGIEIGWASANNIPIICIYRSGTKPSSAIRFISDRVIEYLSSEDMIEKLRTEIEIKL